MSWLLLFIQIKRLAGNELAVYTIHLHRYNAAGARWLIEPIVAFDWQVLRVAALHHDIGKGINTIYAWQVQAAIVDAVRCGDTPLQRL